MDLEAGVQIGDFRIERRLGAGGMGIVYQARQVSLNRTVALKVLGNALNRPSDIARFQREAQAVARLHHPGIASVYFIGQDQQVCYIAMEYIDGVSLRMIIDRLATIQETHSSFDVITQQTMLADTVAPTVRFDQTTETYVPSATLVTESDRTAQDRLTPEARQFIASRDYLRRCCEIVRDAAVALTHAHERGVVHRDIKPENLLLDRQLHVHLIDFGVARFFEDMTVTNTGQLVGTPMYMSPEQVTGRLQFDHRTDIYSLGLVLYELLTLRPPIQSPTREGILRQVVTKALVPVSWLNASVPRDLERVVHQATAKDPDERYPSAADLAADVQNWLDGKPVKAERYRYKLDPREVISARPAEVMFAGFWVLFASLYSVLVGLEGFWSELFSRGLGSVNPRDVTTFLLGFLYFFVGRGLLLAQAWSRWVGIALGVFNVLLFSLWSYSLAMGWDRFIGSYTFSLFMAITVCWGATIGILLERRVRDWFHFAERLRSEHKQLR